MASKKSLRSAVGPAPRHDSLGAVNWMQKTLAAMAQQVLDDNTLTQAEKRKEMLRIADRMSKLRDPDRLYQAEQSLRGVDDAINQTTIGVPLQDAPNLDESPRPITARRGRPPRSSLR